MWTFYSLPYQLVLGISFLLVCSTSSNSQDRDYSINQSQNSIALPGVARPSGFDEIRAADGTTCRASMAGSGAFLDSGVIGNAANTLAAYGRLVVPLGRRPTRLNCDRLYQLELQRLELEVKLMQQGLDPRLQSDPSEQDLDDSIWTTEGRR